MNYPIAEIVCLGNELLMGVTVNTNATFIGEQLTSLGFEVRRVTSIRDDLELATEFFHELFERKPNVIVITGGLGPTYDDIQLEVLSNATNLSLEENPLALDMVKSYYKKKGLKMSKERRKMALFPLGAKILDNKVGGAPGCIVSYEGMEFFCLPGVPPEMKDIFNRHIYSYLREKSRFKIFDIKFTVLNCVESELAPYINKVKKEFIELYIKSHPWFGEREGIVIHISGSEKIAKDKIESAKIQLINLICENIIDAKIKEE